MYQKKNLASILAVMSAVLILLCLASLMSGRFGITPGDIYDLFAAKLSGNEDTSGGAYAVLFESRIPRIAAALLIGRMRAGGIEPAFVPEQPQKFKVTLQLLGIFPP